MHTTLTQRVTARLLLTLAALAVVWGAFGCHTMDRYRPGPRPPLAQGQVDPRPDLAGAPVLEGHELYRLERFLRETFPCGRDWVLRSSPLTGSLLGVTHYDCPLWLDGSVAESGALVVEVRDDLPGWLQREVLAHEFAHVLAWNAPETGHGSVWAAYLGLIYRWMRDERGGLAIAPPVEPSAVNECTPYRPEPGAQQETPDAP